MGYDAVLVTMPWEGPEHPSIALGILKRTLAAQQVTSRVQYFNLAWIDYLLEHGPKDRPFTFKDYWAGGSTLSGIGEWLFAIEPIWPKRPSSKATYSEFLRTRHDISDAEAERLLRLEPLVQPFLERCCDAVLADKPRIVGFTTKFAQNVPSLVLARLLKQRAPDVAIVFGGSNCEGPMGVALHASFPWIDVVVRGEAETVAPQLFRELLDGSPITPQPGLCFRRDGESIVVDNTAGQVAMDEVPPPDLDDYFEQLTSYKFSELVRGDVKVPFESSRGCWWGEKQHCTFCGLNGRTMAFRSKSPDRVYEELISQAERYKQLNFNAVDNIMDLAYFEQLLPRLRAGGYDFRIFYETKANLKKAQLVTFRDAGVLQIQPGIESLSTPILKLMNKGVTALQNIRLIKWCEELGLRAGWNVIYGFPGEPPGEYARMANVMESLTHLLPPDFIRLELDRFSPYHHDPARYGIEITGPDEFCEHIYPLARERLLDLTYGFTFRYADQRDPESYVGSARAFVKRWHAEYRQGALVYRRGPRFLLIHDTRFNLGESLYELGDLESRIYLHADAGATPVQIAKAICAEGKDVTAAEVKAYCDTLVEARLMYEEQGRYLALAVAARPPVTQSFADTGRDDAVQSGTLIPLRRLQGTA